MGGSGLFSECKYVHICVSYVLGILQTGLGMLLKGARFMRCMWPSRRRISVADLGLFVEFERTTLFSAPAASSSLAYCVLRMTRRPLYSSYISIRRAVRGHASERSICMRNGHVQLRASSSPAYRVLRMTP